MKNFSKNQEIKEIMEETTEISHIPAQTTSQIVEQCENCDSAIFIIIVNFHYFVKKQRFRKNLCDQGNNKKDSLIFNYLSHGSISK